MGFRRRDFMKWGLAQAAIISIATRARAQAEKVIKVIVKDGPSILQGATDDTKTQFSILHDAKSTYQFFVTNGKGKTWAPDLTAPVTFGTNTKKITKVYFSNLISTEVYYLNVRDAKTQKIVDTREFQTLDIHKESLKFAVCSCLKEDYHEPQAWLNMAKQKPDLIFIVGDAVYADRGAKGGKGATPDHLWKRFSESRTILELYFLKRLIPVLAVWDDHDFGLNDGDRTTYPYVKESQWNFTQFFAQEESHCRFLEHGPGISSALRLNDQLFLLLDNRTYRDKKGSNDRYAHWGHEQETWFLDLMRKNQGPTWFMTGSQVFPTAPFKNSVSRDHVANFNGLLKELKTVPSKAIFVTGDVHYSEISTVESNEVGYPTYELTSSSVHSNGIPGAPGVIHNSRRMKGAAVGDRNFMIVESFVNGFGSNFTTTCYSIDGKIYFKKTLDV